MQQVFHLARYGNPGGIVDPATAARRHPVAKFKHMGPARSSQLFAVLTIVQMLFIADFDQPLVQEYKRRFGALGVAGTKLQVVHIAAKFVQAADSACWQHAGQARAEQRFKKA